MFARFRALVDAIGGVATIVLTITALSGINQPVLAAIATIVFGAALLIQGGTMLTEYSGALLRIIVLEPIGGLTRSARMYSPETNDVSLV